MEIETERLRMRKIALEDADEHLRIISDPEFMRPMGPQFQPTRDKVLVGVGRMIEHWYQFGYGLWVLELKGAERHFGYCGLRHLMPTDEVELFYGCDRAYWGRGLVTEADHAKWTPADLRPYIDHVVYCFGLERFMFGGDWPVSTQAAEYPRWVATLDDALRGCSPGEFRKIYVENAEEFYRL
jgi:hypothetical protein